MKQRLFAFDALKFFAIFLVLWGHSLQYLQSTPFQDNLLYRIIYSFHMPLFMMVAGYFSISSLELPFWGFIKKKGIQLILPALVWSVIVGGADFLMGKNLSLINHIIEDYWFLKCLFICYTILWFGNRTRMNLWIWIIITILLSQFIDYFKVPLLYSCFIVGYLLRRKTKFLELVSNKIFVVLLGVLFLVSLQFWGIDFWKPLFGLKRAIALMATGGLNIDWFYYRYYPYLIGIVGSLFFIGLSLCCFGSYNPNNKVTKIMSRCGRETLGIYLVQLLILETIIPNYLKFDNMYIWFFSLALTPLVAFLILAICMQIIKLIRRSNIATLFLLGEI